MNYSYLSRYDIGIMSRLRMDDRGFKSRRKQEIYIYLFPKRFSPAQGPTPPPIKWIQGSLSPEVMRLGCKADHSPPSSVQVKYECTSTSTPPRPPMSLWHVQEQFFLLAASHTHILFVCFPPPLSHSRFPQPETERNNSGRPHAYSVICSGNSETSVCC
jgi:hypothetical protein